MFQRKSSYNLRIMDRVLMCKLFINDLLSYWKRLWTSTFEKIINRSKIPKNVKSKKTDQSNFYGIGKYIFKGCRRNILHRNRNRREVKWRMMCFNCPTTRYRRMSVSSTIVLSPSWCSFPFELRWGRLLQTGPLSSSNGLRDFSIV